MKFSIANISLEEGRIAASNKYRDDEEIKKKNVKIGECAIYFELLLKRNFKNFRQFKFKNKEISASDVLFT